MIETERETRLTRDVETHDQSRRRRSFGRDWCGVVLSVSTGRRPGPLKGVHDGHTPFQTVPTGTGVELSTTNWVDHVLPVP